MNEVLKQIGEIGIVPVIAISDEQKAVPLAKALIAGGIPCAEITFRTAQGEESIRRIAAQVPEILLGAGTVLTTQQVDRAIAAGAKFIVSPGLNPKVVQHCIDKGIPVTPGCSCPSDIEAALELGLEVVKFFPAEQTGGLDYIKAVAAPYNKIKFIPTGGINSKNVCKYLRYEKVLACGGSWMVKKSLIDAGEFEEITRLCKEAVNQMLDFHIAHIGVNCDEEAQAYGAAGLLETLFGLEPKDSGGAIFSGSIFEIMKQPGRGKMGHIAIGCPDPGRAAAYLKRNGAVFIDETYREDEKGLKFVYLKDEIAGFALHLLRSH